MNTQWLTTDYFPPPPPLFLLFLSLWTDTWATKCAAAAEKEKKAHNTNENGAEKVYATTINTYWKADVMDTPYNY